MNQRSYVKAVSKRLACSKARQVEFVGDLESDIAAALDAGESWEQIERRMGDPRQVASEFNEDLPESELVAGKKRKRTKIIVIVAASLVAVAVVIAAAVWWVTPHQGPVTQVTDAESVPVVVQAQTIVEMFDDRDYDGMRAIAGEEGAATLTDQLLDNAHKTIADGDWGAFESYGNIYTAEATQMGMSFQSVSMVAVYENVVITYTITFNSNGELTLFWLS